MAHTTARRSVSVARVLRVRGPESSRARDRLAGEEPMEIRLGGPGQEPVAIAVTMRTPGHDFALAAGFCVTEGLAGPQEIARVAYCDDVGAEDQLYNVVTVRLSRPVDPDLARRAVYATSSCGVCGKGSIDQVEVLCARMGPGPELAEEALVALPEGLRAAQSLFEATGGLHAAGLADAAGRLGAVREDVGRHNAVDKVLGEAALAGALPASSSALVVSGRASFEIVQKAAVAGVPIVAAVSAPSSLAVATAERLGMTLVGFLRGDGYNVYAGAERIAR